jgi:hypothetical protein
VQVTCSLGYAQYLPQVTRWCRAEDDLLPNLTNFYSPVAQVTCSLGYAQYLPRVTRWCRAEDDFLPNLCSHVAQVTCSLGYAQYLPRVTRWCRTEDDLSAIPMAPTKHNILCSAKPALQVFLIYILITKF